jgi:hypothetical protein
MPEQASPPNGPGSTPRPVAPASPSIDLFTDGAPASDDAPTIISKTPPTQTFFPNGLAENGASLRGRTLAHFELLEPIGVGGMAAVLRARDKQLDRFVALKILPPEMATDPEHVDRFHQEARAAAKLDHENIARVYYCGEDQKLHFIAFEFVEGQNLRTLLERRGRLPVAEAVHYLLQIATGLAHAAARGVVHRDIKPSNIIITPGGRAKLVDMGLARSLAPHDNRQLTQSGVTLGTFDYISPEQALEPRDADVRSDIYSLGCTFYHMLTGVPPVPEGTAAKKLHHHQHVLPVDPRQLNPEIPDDVAAILQRMMVKDCKERYQRAEHLVQHLLQAAQKLGGVDVPEGVLFVDAPLPAPPRKRPVMLAAVALSALALFVLAVALVPPRTNLPPGPRVKVAGPTPKDEPPPKGNGPGKGKDIVLVVETRVVVSEEEFAKALAEERSLKIVLDKDLRLTDAGLVYRGSAKRTLVIESADKNKPATIQTAYAAEVQNPLPFWAGLTVDGGTVLFRNVRFEVESSRTPRQLVAGVVVKAGSATFEGCEFAQQVPQEEGGLIGRRSLVPVASVAAWDPGLGSGERAPLVFRKCYFAGGQAAVSLKGVARLEQTNCALGAHACLYHLWGQDKDDDARAEVILANVSAHVVDGPVFRLDDNAGAYLSVQYSLFSCPRNSSSRDRPDLIRQTGPTTRKVTYKGVRNGYHDLMAFWVRPAGKDDIEAADWPTFAARIKAAGGADVNSSVLTASPWASTNPAGEEKPQAAFEINPRLPELRRLEKDLRNHPIGVEACAWGPMPTLPALEPVRPDPTVVQLAPGERLVDPRGTTRAEPAGRVHKKLEGAISEAEPGDVILIKHNGPLPLEPVKLTENRSVKLRPFGDSHPVLVLGKSTDRDTVLFHLHHSQLEFEQLEIWLQPDAKHRSLTLVHLGGQSLVQFKQCVITLDPGDNPAAELDVVGLQDPRDMMKSAVPEPRPRPEIHFVSTLVRGKGDLVDVRASRAFDLDLDGCLVALNGSLLTCRAGMGDAMTPEARASVKLNRTTTFTTEPVLLLTSGTKSGRGLAPTQVTATGCLFAGAAGRPLVRLDGPEGEMAVKKLLSWGGSTNAYAGFEKYLETMSGDAGTAVAYYEADWKRFAEVGADSKFVGAQFQPMAGTERVFSKLQPAEFRLKSDLGAFGAVPDQLPLPRPELAPPEITPGGEN